MKIKQYSKFNQLINKQTVICLIGVIILFSTLLPQVETDLKPTLSTFDSNYYSAASSVPVITARPAQPGQSEYLKNKRIIPTLTAEESVLRNYSIDSQIHLINHFSAAYGTYYGNYQQACLLLDIPPPSPSGLLYSQYTAESTPENKTSRSFIKLFRIIDNYEE